MHSMTCELTCNLIFLGETLGIPSPIPLKINKHPSSTTITGINRLNLLRKLKETNDFEKIARLIIGKVPKPNKIMYTIPIKGPEVDKAPTNAK